MVISKSIIFSGFYLAAAKKLASIDAKQPTVTSSPVYVPEICRKHVEDNCGPIQCFNIKTQTDEVTFNEDVYVTIPIETNHSCSLTWKKYSVTMCEKQTAIHLPIGLQHNLEAESSYTQETENISKDDRNLIAEWCSQKAASS